MKYPNFFLIGAPKSGTTSMYNYLKEHPNVFMSDIKGPHFFASDLNDHERVEEEEDYLNLFINKSKNHFAVGEASVLYLSSKKAIKNISKKIPNSKLIIILRNPLEVIQSWHAEMVWSRLETNEDLEDAWYKSINYSNKKHDNIKLDYQNIFKFGEQVFRVFKYFKKENLKIIYYETYLNSTKNTLSEINDFLNIPNYEKDSFLKHNTYKKYKNKFLQDFITDPPLIILKVLNYIKIKFGIKRVGLFKKILKYNTYHPIKPEISYHLKKSIIERYTEDVHNLSKILKKDFIALWFKNI